MKKIGLVLGLIAFLGLVVTGCGLKAEKITLEEAKKTAGFTVLTPGYVPDGFKIKEITKVGKGDKGIITLNYQNGNKSLIIIENKKVGDFKQPSDSEKIKINGNDGSITTTKGTTIVMWIQEGTMITLTGEVDKDTVLKIAESFK